MVTKGGKIALTGFVICAAAVTVVNVAPEYTETASVAAGWGFLIMIVGWIVCAVQSVKSKPEQPKQPVDWATKAEEWKVASTIVSTAIVDTTMKSKTKASATSSVVRGAVGYGLLGPAGAAVGALTPKKTTITKAKTVTFSVRYANGECRIETVKNGSKRFYELAKYIA